jgi:hypothetical protein
MNCEQAREAMADALVGKQDPALQNHLQVCQSCAREFERLEIPCQRMDAWQSEEPAPHVRVRFHDMLEAYEQGARQRKARSFWYWQVGLAAACLVAGFFGGKGFATQNSDVAELRKEVSGMRQLVTLSLLQQQSATERLRGVNWAYQTEPSDMEVLGALLRTLNTDPNVNVRLAAMDAIQNFSRSSVARRGLVQALPKQTSPLVQVALVDMLVDMKQVDAKPEIQTLLASGDLDPTVRDRLEQAMTRLQ